MGSAQHVVTGGFYDYHLLFSSFPEPGGKERCPGVTWAACCGPHL